MSELEKLVFDRDTSYCKWFVANKEDNTERKLHALFMYQYFDNKIKQIAE